MEATSFEELLTLTDAAKILPRRRRGKRPAPSTLYRWAQKGINGVRLETVQCAGTKCTSRQLLAEFFRRLSDKGGTCRDADERAANADASLDELGFS